MNILVQQIVVLLKECHNFQLKIEKCQNVIMIVTTWYWNIHIEWVRKSVMCTLRLPVKQWVVSGTGWNCRVCSGSVSTRNRTVARGLTPRKTWTIRNRPVLPPKTRHFKFTILPPIKYLGSNRILTQRIRKLCSFWGSFTSRCQICNSTCIHWVAIDNPQISLEICHHFTITQWIEVGLQISKHEPKERHKLTNIRIDHVMIPSKLK